MNSPRSSRSAKENYEAQTDGRAHSADRRTPPRSCTHFNSERLQTRLLNWDINVSSTVCVRVSSVGNNAAMRSRRRRRCAFDRDARRTHISLSPSLNPSPPHRARTRAHTHVQGQKFVEMPHEQKVYEINLSRAIKCDYTDTTLNHLFMATNISAGFTFNPSVNTHL